MKNKFIQFLKELIIIVFVFTIIEFLFYKFGLIKEFGIIYIVGFAIGWTIIKITAIVIDSRKKSRE